MTPSMDDHEYNKFFRAVISTARIMGFKHPIEQLCGYYDTACRVSTITGCEGQINDAHAGYFIYEAYTDVMCEKLPKRSHVIEWCKSCYPEGHLAKIGFDLAIVEWLNHVPDNYFYPEPKVVS